ncbi:hypothetical protein HDE_12424 [Halotydeus destructor]|nr:hypothetical protein HDE_12424 [Halotydeus destructor]
MPFIGRDWRSPGEAWVKTDEGSWEKLKILETSTVNSQSRNVHHDQSGFHSGGDSSTESDSDTEGNGCDDGSALDTNQSRDACLKETDSGRSRHSSDRGSQSPTLGRPWGTSSHFIRH